MHVCQYIQVPFKQHCLWKSDATADMFSSSLFAVGYDDVRQ